MLVIVLTLISVCDVISAREGNDVLLDGADVYPLSQLNQRRGLDFCQTNPNPCEHGGHCCSEAWCGQEGGAQYTCRCEGAYSGPNCEKKCPLKECWHDFYTKAYNNGRKRAMGADTCTDNVETLGKCIQSAMTSTEICDCDVTDRTDAMLLGKVRKEVLIAKECSSNAGVCSDPQVEKCMRKIHTLDGAIDSGKDLSQPQKCSMVKEAISCMHELSAHDFTGCVWNRKLFTEKVAIRHAQWRTWCMGKYCSLYGCGQVQIPRGCSADSVRGKTLPVVKCMRNKLETCLPGEKIQEDMADVQEELDAAITVRCHLHKQVSDQCDVKREAKTLQARDLLRALLERTLSDD